MDQIHYCHLCNEPSYYLSSREPTFQAQCCIKNCDKRFCIQCIHSLFDDAFQQRTFKYDTWICYSCQQRCQCTACVEAGEKKAKGRKVLLNAFKSEPKVEIIRQQQPIDDYYSQQQLDSASPFMRKLFGLRNHMFKLMANSNVKGKSMTSNNGRQVDKEKRETSFKVEGQIGGRNIKQIIKETLVSYDNEENDFQFID